jgi:hypothetical protein
MTDGTLTAKGLTGRTSLTLASTNGNIIVSPNGNNHIKLFTDDYSGTGKAYYKGKELVVVESTGKLDLGYFPDVILGQLVFGGTVVINTSVSPTTATASLSAHAKTKLKITDDRTITLQNAEAPAGDTKTG